jgi:hypothetical protein
MAKDLNRPKDINGHHWVLDPVVPGSKIGTWKCQHCLTSYTLGCGRFLKCDHGESMRKPKPYPEA